MAYTPDMELRHLRYFVAVAEQLSFRGAAEKLHVAQPSLGRQVRDLEEELGETLFDRDRKHVALTDAGRVFFDHARRVLAAADEAIEAVRDVGRGARGMLRIGNVGLLSSSFLPRNLSAFREVYPEVEIEVLEVSHRDQSAALLSGAIQIGLQPLNPAWPIDPRLSSRVVVTSEVYVILPKRHAHAGDRSIALPDLAEETFLDYQPRRGSTYGQFVAALCREYGGFTQRLRRSPVDNPTTLFAMVAAGEGIAILPKIATIDGSRRGGWIAKPMRAPKPKLDLAVVWKTDTRSLVVQNYVAMLRKRPLRARAR